MTAATKKHRTKRAGSSEGSLVASITSMLEDLGFRVGRTGWHDLGTLRVAVDGDTVSIYSFAGLVGTVLAWEVEMSLHGTPFSVIRAVVQAAVDDSAK